MFIDYIETGLSIEGGKYYGEFERIFNNLKGGSPIPTIENINVIGAVVTGTASDLTALADEDMIQALYLA